MKDNLFELSDGLFDLRRAFQTNDGFDMTMTAEQVRWMNTVLLHFGQTALKQAHEISRHRWNLLAKTERDVESERVTEAACQPGANVYLFPIVPRPFSDGPPKGGAA